MTDEVIDELRAEPVKVPQTIGGARVVCYAAISGRHQVAEGAVGDVPGGGLGPPVNLAICQYDGDESFYLFTCDHEWRSQSDTWHQNLESAREQAEYECAGAKGAWLHPMGSAWRSADAP